MTKTALMEKTRALTARSLRDLRGYKVLAVDGDIGKIDDFYYDDVTWALRYVVVDTGSWLSSRRVLVSPTAFTGSNGPHKTITTALTRKQVEEAPTADLAKPVSRQFELQLNEHFAWPLYWINAPVELQGEDGDKHLRSVSETLGYTIDATDGNIGHVEDFVVDENDWIIRYLAIDTRNWLPGRKVIVSPTWISDVSWAKNTVTVDLPRDTIKIAPKYDPNEPINRVYEERLYDAYGRPGYWQ